MIDSKLPDKVPDYPSAGPVPDEWDRACDQCGYSLTGLVDTVRCPECGAEFNPFALPQARIPWLRRLTKGTLRAYFATAGLVIFDPHGIAEQITRPAQPNLAAARDFSRYTTYVVAVSTFLSFTAWGIVALMTRRLDAYSIILSIVSVVTISAAMSFVSALMTFLPIVPSHEGTLRYSRLECMRHYASATSILLPIAANLVLAAASQAEILWKFVICFLGIGVPAVMYWVRLMLLLSVGKTPIRYFVLSFVMFFAWWFIAGVMVLMFSVTILAGIESALRS